MAQKSVQVTMKYYQSPTASTYPGTSDTLAYKEVTIDAYTQDYLTLTLAMPRIPVAEGKTPSGNWTVGDISYSPEPKPWEFEYEDFWEPEFGGRETRRGGIPFTFPQTFDITWPSVGGKLVGKTGYINLWCATATSTVNHFRARIKVNWTDSDPGPEPPPEQQEPGQELDETPDNFELGGWKGVGEKNNYYYATCISGVNMTDNESTAGFYKVNGLTPNTTVPLSVQKVSGTATSAQHKVNNGSWTGSTRQIKNGDIIKFRVRASGTAGNAVRYKWTLGKYVSDQLQVTTRSNTPTEPTTVLKVPAVNPTYEYSSTGYKVNVNPSGEQSGTINYIFKDSNNNVLQNWSTKDSYTLDARTYEGKTVKVQARATKAGYTPIYSLEKSVSLGDFTISIPDVKQGEQIRASITLDSNVKVPVTLYWNLTPSNSFSVSSGSTTFTERGVRIINTGILVKENAAIQTTNNLTAYFDSGKNVATKVLNRNFNTIQGDQVDVPDSVSRSGFGLVVRNKNNQVIIDSYNNFSFGAVERQKSYNNSDPLLDGGSVFSTGVASNNLYFARPENNYYDGNRNNIVIKYNWTQAAIGASNPELLNGQYFRYEKQGIQRGVTNFSLRAIKASPSGQVLLDDGGYGLKVKDTSGELIFHATSSSFNNTLDVVAVSLASPTPQSIENAYARFTEKVLMLETTESLDNYYCLFNSTNNVFFSGGGFGGGFSFSVIIYSFYYYDYTRGQIWFVRDMPQYLYNLYAGAGAENLTSTVAAVPPMVVKLRS